MDVDSVMLVRVTVGNLEFCATLETKRAPRTCAYFVSLMPYRQKLVHCRWSGEACWIPLGDLETGLPFENATSYPSPGQVIFYPGGYSETELLVAYGPVRFASKLGQLAGNHFMTITGHEDTLREVGRRTLWEGAQDMIFDLG